MKKLKKWLKDLSAYKVIAIILAIGTVVIASLGESGWGWCLFVLFLMLLDLYKQEIKEE